MTTTSPSDTTIVTSGLQAPFGEPLVLSGGQGSTGVTIDTLTVTTLTGPTITNDVASSLTAPSATALTLSADAGYGVVFSPVTGTAETDVLVASNPTAPASTADFAMQGLAGTITPQHTGTVLVVISGTIIDATTAAGDGITHQISYGTGVAPNNADALGGTQVGPIQVWTASATVTAADVHVPFTITALITGLTLNTAYWIDLAAKSVGHISSGGFGGVSIVAVEIH